MLPLSGSSSGVGRHEAGVFLRERRKKAILGATLGGIAETAGRPPHWSIIQ